MENVKEEKTKIVCELPNHAKQHPDMTEKDYHVCDEYSAEQEDD